MSMAFRPWKYLFLVIGLLAFSMANAQESRSVSGVLVDSAGVSVAGATVLLSKLPGGTMAGFAYSDSAGVFSIPADSAGSYEVKVTFIGFGTFATEIDLPETGDMDLGEIILHESAYDLNGVVIKGRFRPIVVRNDTIEYDADSFHAGEGATVEDLLKKLPGITVEDDGTVKAQGEEVKQVLVDGKEFFDDDPKVATKNIPADVVDKVQVFDDPSDFTKFTGIKDGEEDKTINLAIKEGKNKGTFGEVKAEYGLDDRYNAGGSLNRFNNRMQLSFLANSNNVSEQAFSIQDYLKFNGSMEDMMSQEIEISELPMNLLNRRGITNSTSGGVNFNYDLSKKTAWRSSYFLDNSNNRTERIMDSGSFLEDGTYLQASNSDEKNELTSHRGNIRLEHKFSKKQELEFRLGGSLSKPFIGGNAFSSSSRSDTLVNISNSNSGISSTIDRWNAQLGYRTKFKKQGRFFTTDLKLDQERREGSGNILNFVGTNDLDTIEQLQLTNGDELSYSASLNYVEPLGKSQYLYLKLKRDQSFRENIKQFYQGTAETDSSLNTLLSNGFDLDLSRNLAGLKYQLNKSKLVCSFGADLQITDLDNKDLVSGDRTRSQYRNVLPNATITWKRSGASNLEARYRTRIRVPEVRQLQPVVDNRDPLNLYLGDPDLDPEYVHDLSVRYHNFNEFYFRSFFAGIQGRLINDVIAERRAVNQELISLTRPINSRAEWELHGYFEYDSPIMDANFKYRLNGDYGTEQYNVLINSLDDRLSVYFVDQRFRLENKKKKTLDWYLAAKGRVRFYRYAESTTYDQELVDFDLTANAKIKFLKNWQVDLKVKQRYYLANTYMNQATLSFLDIELSRHFMDKTLKVYVRGVNLLDETISVQRQLYGNTYSDGTSDRLGSLLLFGLSYKIRSFGK